MKLNPQDVHMNTPLHFCCNNGHMESATLLMIVSGCYDYYYHVPNIVVCEIYHGSSKFGICLAFLLLLKMRCCTSCTKYEFKY